MIILFCFPFSSSNDLYITFNITSRCITYHCGTWVPLRIGNYTHTIKLSHTYIHT